MIKTHVRMVRHAPIVREAISAYAHKALKEETAQKVKGPILLPASSGKRGQSDH